MKKILICCMSCILFYAIDLYALGVGVKLTHNLGTINFNYEDMTDLVSFQFLKPESGFLHSSGIGAFLDTNPDGTHWFGYRFTAELLCGNTFPDNSLSLVRVHFINIPHFKLYRNDSIKLWIGPMIAFGGVYGARSSKSYIMIFPNFLSFNDGLVYPFKIGIKNFYFNAGGAVGININLKNASTLTIEAGARLGISSSVKNRVPYSAGSISGVFSIIEGYISFGYLYRIADSSAKVQKIENIIIIQ